METQQLTNLDPAKTEALASSVQSESVPTPPSKTPDNKVAFSKTISNKLKENKIFFYGFPVVVVIVIFIGLFLFIIPTIQYYFESQVKEESLDQNIQNVNQSISNLQRARQEESLIKSYDTALSEYIPTSSKLGDVLNVIQTKAQDFNLESKIGVNQGTSGTSINNLARKDQDNNALFQSISSGEITFVPQSLNTDINAVLMSIEVNIRGDKDSFFRFIKETKTVKPLINVAFVEYQESNENGKATVSAVVKFESYALKLNTDSVRIVSPRQYTAGEPALFRNIPVEKFDWDKSVGQRLTNGSAN